MRTYMTKIYEKEPRMLVVGTLSATVYDTYGIHISAPCIVSQKLRELSTCGKGILN